jgi:hypothetical protein
MSTVQSTQAVSWIKRLQLSAAALFVSGLAVWLLAVTLEHFTIFNGLAWLPSIFIVLQVIGLLLTLKWPRIGAIILALPFLWELGITYWELKEFADNWVIVGLLILEAAIAIFGLVCVVQVFLHRRNRVAV